MSWQDRGACVGLGTDVFFRDDKSRLHKKRAQEHKAKTVCRPCPVRNQCLDHALTRVEWYGVWGGLTEDERAVIRNQRKVSNG